MLGDLFLNRIRFLVVLMLTAIIGCFLIGLKDTREEIVEHFVVYEHVFGSVKNITLNWQERLSWSTVGESEDEIRFSWFADGIVKVYFLTETQFENLMSNTSTTVYCEYFAEFHCGVMQVVLVNDDSYYVVVENQSPLLCKVKLYAAECKLLRASIARESQSVEIYPYEEVGAMIILLTVSIGLLSLPKR